MEYIKGKFNIVGLDSFEEDLDVTPCLPTIAVTFDDAYKNLAKEAIPILHELKSRQRYMCH